MVAGSMVGGLDKARATAGCLTHSCSSTTGRWGFLASCQLLHPLGPRSGSYIPTTALGTQRGQSRQKPVNVSCQKQIVVFPAGLAKPSFWGEREGELGC